MLVPRDTLRVNEGPIFQTPTENLFPHNFLDSPKGPKTPPGGHFRGGFSFYWVSLQSPVMVQLKKDISGEGGKKYQKTFSSSEQFCASFFHLYFLRQ